MQKATTAAIHPPPLLSSFPLSLYESLSSLSLSKHLFLSLDCREKSVGEGFPEEDADVAHGTRGGLWKSQRCVNGFCALLIVD